jgi:hypothetical protein
MSSVDSHLFVSIGGWHPFVIPSEVEQGGLHRICSVERMGRLALTGSGDFQVAERSNKSATISACLACSADKIQPVRLEHTDGARDENDDNG